MLIAIPENVNISTFWKGFAKQITILHNDFYKKKIPGRSEARYHTAERIQKVLDKYKGKNYSINKLMSLVGKELELSEGYIKRHFKEIIREFKSEDAKTN